MVLDTSALLAVLLNEPEAAAFRLAIESDPVRLLSAANLVETSIVIEHAGFTNRTVFPDPQYRASARLAGYLAHKYLIRPDRQHVIGHNQVPDPTHRGQLGGFAHMESVMGMLERKRSDKHSTVRVVHVPNTKKQTLERQVAATVEQGAHMIGGGWEIRLLEEAGVMLQGAGRLDEAEEVYRRIIELAPMRVYAYLYTAGAEASRGHDELAAQWYTKVIDVEPNNAEACRYLTRFTAENPKNQAARESVSKCRLR